MPVATPDELYNLMAVATLEGFNGCVNCNLMVGCRLTPYRKLLKSLPFN
jgi:hypothetical protein